MSAFSKSDLVAVIRSKSDLTKAAAEALVDTIFQTIVDRTAAGQQVSIHGFGRFDMRDRAARIARNPRTGERVDVPATRRLAFKPAAKVS
jgi:nucleoid DNA-binding protein